MLRKHLNQESGQSLIEYTVLLGLLALAVLGGVTLLSDRVGAQLAAIDNAMARIVQADASTPELPPQDDSGNADDQDDEDKLDEDAPPAKPGRPIRPLPPERPEKPWFPWLAWPW